MKKSTPQEIYEAALRERAQPDPLKKRQACEKGWRATIAAVDAFLKEHGKQVRTGLPEAHGDRRDALSELANTDPDIRKLAQLVSHVMEDLHGGCFYAGKDKPYYTIMLKEDVREILELAGFPVNDTDE